MSMPRRQVDVSSLNDTRSFGKDLCDTTVCVRNDSNPSLPPGHIPPGDPEAPLRVFLNRGLAFALLFPGLPLMFFFRASGAADVARPRHLPADARRKKRKALRASEAQKHDSRRGKGRAEMGRVRGPPRDADRAISAKVHTWTNCRSYSTCSREKWRWWVLARNDRSSSRSFANGFRSTWADSAFSPASRVWLN